MESHESEEILNRFLYGLHGLMAALPDDAARELGARLCSVGVLIRFKVAPGRGLQLQLVRDDPLDADVVLTLASLADFVPGGGAPN